VIQFTSLGIQICFSSLVNIIFPFQLFVMIPIRLFLIAWGV
jgi:hypothetical protein